jgi:hypothetical protein
MLPHCPAALHSHPIYMPEGMTGKYGNFPCYDPSKVCASQLLWLRLCCGCCRGWGDSYAATGAVLELGAATNALATQGGPHPHPMLCLLCALCRTWSSLP